MCSYLQPPLPRWRGSVWFSACAQPMWWHIISFHIFLSFHHFCTLLGWCSGKDKSRHYLLVCYDLFLVPEKNIILNCFCNNKSILSIRYQIFFGITKWINLKYISPYDVSKDAQLTDHVHKLGRLARSYHVVGRHWGLNNIFIICVSSEVTLFNKTTCMYEMKGLTTWFAIFSIYLYPVHEDVGISFFTMLNLLLWDL